MDDNNQNLSTGATNPEERLWEYIDGTLSAEDSTAVEQLISTNNVWKAKYKELLEVNELLHSSELSAPSMRFTRNVMEEIGRLHIAPATNTYINNRIVWGLGIFFILMVIGFITYGLGQVDWKSSDGSAIPVDLQSIDYSKMFNNSFVNVFMMINVILGLILFDRFLSNKRKKMRQGNIPDA